MTDAQRTEAVISAVNNLVGSVESMQETLTQLVVEMREPPSSELPELMRALIAQSQNMNVALVASSKMLEGLAGTVAQMGARISELRDQIMKVTGR
jgi:hypothetical protein